MRNDRRARRGEAPDIGRSLFRVSVFAVVVWALLAIVVYFSAPP